MNRAGPISSRQLDRRFEGVDVPGSGPAKARQPVPAPSKVDQARGVSLQTLAPVKVALAEVLLCEADTRRRGLRIFNEGPQVIAIGPRDGVIDSPYILRARESLLEILAPGVEWWAQVISVDDSGDPTARLKLQATY